MKPDLVWSACLGELQLQMTQATFDTWLRGARFLKFEDGSFVVGVKNGYAKDWLENRLMPTILRTIVRLAGQAVEVRFVVWDEHAQRREAAPLLDRPEPETAPQPTPQHCEAALPPAKLNPRYAFDSFVVGLGNRLAHAASMAVAESPAQAYNPLFVYGGVGLGKTHLLHAIGHACHAQGLHVLYGSSEDFTNDLIEAIRSQTTDAFRDKYRTADVLLVDDIQFIAGKESTQEEFFHTFNALHRAGKQIVLSSDRPPKAMATLEERLCSRFEWGLIADIQPPDLETRIAILQTKAAGIGGAAVGGADVPDDILALIADRFQSNIRELEGALNRVVAMSRLTHQPLTTELAEEALGELMPRRSRLTEEQIVETVADHFGLERAAFESRSRSRAIARPRQVAMYLLREETGASLPQIGALLGGRDHTTVLYGCERIADLIQEDAEMRREVVRLRQRLHAATC
jgi:chromosomal replication initiator protein